FGSLMGDSEKGAREIFREYYEKLLDAQVLAEPSPILFLVEVEGILGERVQVNQSSDQTHNAVTGILLQCLGSLPRQALVIAAGNFLSANVIDGAFSRRFLRKVPFVAPDAQLRLR